MALSILKSLQVFQKTSVVQGEINLKLVDKDWKHRPTGGLSSSITRSFEISVPLNLLSKVYPQPLAETISGQAKLIVWAAGSEGKVR